MTERKFIDKKELERFIDRAPNYWDHYDYMDNLILLPVVSVPDIAEPLIANTLSMLRQDLLDRLAEERSPYHISDVGIGLEIAIKIIEEYEEKLK